MTHRHPDADNFISTAYNAYNILLSTCVCGFVTYNKDYLLTYLLTD